MLVAQNNLAPPMLARLGPNTDATLLKLQTSGSTSARTGTQESNCWLELAPKWPMLFGGWRTWGRHTRPLIRT